MVVDVGELADYGYWGEVLTTGAQARGIGGLVIDGGVRDILAIETLGFPVFASTIALRGASNLPFFTCTHRSRRFENATTVETGNRRGIEKTAELSDSPDFVEVERWHRVNDLFHHARIELL